MNRRGFLRSVAAAGGIALGMSQVRSVWGGQADAPGSRGKPNFIFLLTDDQGWGDLGCFGHRLLRTPHLDAFAAGACRFTDFYSCSPVCAPSRAGSMTGRDPNRFNMKFLCHNGQYDAPVYHHVPLGEPMLPRQLRGAGYRTCHIGKWHLSIPGQIVEPTPTDYGFDHYLIQPPGGRGLYKNPTDWNRNGATVPGKLADWASDLYVDEAIRLMQETRDQPFYINLWTFTPHEDVLCADSFKDLYPGCTEPERTYYGALTQQDEAFGRLFRFLDEAGLAENTVVVFASDNGPEHPLLPWVKNSAGSTGPFRGSKHILYEGGIRVPGIIRWPGLSQAGSVSRAPVSTLDLFPSFCGAAGVPMPPDTSFDGADMRAALRCDPVDRPHALYWQYDRAPSEHKSRGDICVSPPLALREGPWKLLCDLDMSGVELYNLNFDEGEKWNLADQYPDVVARLLEQVKAIHADVAASSASATGFLNPDMPPPGKEPIRLG